MPRRLTNLRIEEVSSVDRGAGRGVAVKIMKREGEKMETLESIAKTIWSPTLGQKVMKAETLLESGRITPEVGAQLVGHFAKEHFAGNFAKALGDGDVARFNTACARKSYEVGQHATGHGDGFAVAKAMSEQSDEDSGDLEEPWDKNKGKRKKKPIQMDACEDGRGEDGVDKFSKAVAVAMSGGLNFDQACSAVIAYQKAAK